MRRPRNFQTDRCYHLVSRVAHRAFYLDEDERTRFVELPYAFMQARIATITPHDWRNSLSTSIIFFDSFIAIQRFLLPEMRVRISINLIVIRSARGSIGGVGVVE